jgi:hypothetical protein
MTRVRMLTTAAGPAFQACAGSMLDLPDALADALVRAGAAEVVEKPPAVPELPTVETATPAPAETAKAVFYPKKGGR